PVGSGISAVLPRPRRRGLSRTPIRGTGDRDSPPVAAGMLHRDGEVGLEDAGSRLRPLDEGDRVVGQVVVEKSRLLPPQVLEAIEVDVGDRDSAAIAGPDREGGRGDGPGDAELAAGAAYEGRLPRAQLARDEHDVAR